VLQILGHLKNGKERKKGSSLVLQMLLSTEEWRQVAQAALHWFETHMMCEPMPRQIFQKPSLHGNQMKQKAETTYTGTERF
jgi:hypothetical protein